MPGKFRPHIGEYATKTNAFRTHKQKARRALEWAPAGFPKWLLRLLLAVINQNLIARLCQLGAVLLQAVQNGEVVLVHHCTAEFLNVMGAGFLLLGRSAMLLLGHCAGGDRQRQQSGYEERFTHCVPLFLRQKIPTRMANGISGADYSD
jgi:hypothetical protein